MRNVTYIITGNGFVILDIHVRQQFLCSNIIFLISSNLIYLIIIIKRFTYTYNNNNNNNLIKVQATKDAPQETFLKSNAIQ